MRVTCTDSKVDALGCVDAPKSWLCAYVTKSQSLQEPRFGPLLHSFGTVREASATASGLLSAVRCRYPLVDGSSHELVGGRLLRAVTMRLRRTTTVSKDMHVMANSHDPHAPCPAIRGKARCSPGDDLTARVAHTLVLPWLRSPRHLPLP